MNTTIGTSQASLNIAATASTRNLYYTKFVSLPIFQTSIAANTWTYAFSALEGSSGCNFPGNGVDQPVYVNCYVWRPSTGAKIGTILDGNTASTVDEPASNTQVYHIVTFSGSGFTIQSGDVIIFEVWFQNTSAASAGQANTFYYDGTTVYTENATSTSAASYLETPETLNFSSGNSFTRNIATETVTITSSVARVFTGFAHYNRAPATETVTILDSVATSANTTGRFTSSQIYPRPVRPRIKIYNLTDSSYSNALYTYDGFSDIGNTGAKPISLSFESTTGNAGTFSLEIEDSTSTLDPDSFSRGNRVVIECSKDGSGWRTAFKGVIRSIDQRVYGQTGKNIILKGYSYLIRLTERVVDFQAQSALDGSGNYIRTDSSMFTNTLLNTILTNDSTYLYTADDTALYNFFKVNNIASSSITQWIPRIDAQLATLNDAVGSIVEFSNSLLGINMSSDQLVLYNQDNVTTDSQIFLVTNKVDKDSNPADTTMYPIEPYSYNFGYDYPDNASRLIASIGTAQCPAVPEQTIYPTLGLPTGLIRTYASDVLFHSGGYNNMHFQPFIADGISLTRVFWALREYNLLGGGYLLPTSHKTMDLHVYNNDGSNHVGSRIAGPITMHRNGVPGTAWPTVSMEWFIVGTEANTLNVATTPASKYWLGIADSNYADLTDNVSTSLGAYASPPDGYHTYSFTTYASVPSPTAAPNGTYLGSSSDMGPTWGIDLSFAQPTVIPGTDACGGPPNTADAEPNFLIAADMNQINRIGMVEKVITSLPDHIKNSQTMNEYLFAKIYSSSKPKFTFDFPSLTMPNIAPKAGDIVVHVDGLARVGLKSSPIQTGIISQINYDFKQDDEGVLGLTKLALSTTGIKRGSY